MPLKASGMCCTCPLFPVLLPNADSDMTVNFAAPRRTGGFLFVLRGSDGCYKVANMIKEMMLQMYVLVVTYLWCPSCFLVLPRLSLGRRLGLLYNCDELALSEKLQVCPHEVRWVNGDLLLELFMRHRTELFSVDAPVANKWADI